MKSFRIIKSPRITALFFVPWGMLCILGGYVFTSDDAYFWTCGISWALAMVFCAIALPSRLGGSSTADERAGRPV